MLASTIIELLTKIILSAELFLTQFLWSLAIKQGLESRNSYLVWKSFNSSLFNLENWFYGLIPFLITLSMAYSGISLVAKGESMRREVLGNAALSIFAMSISTLAMKYVLEISYYSSGIILSMSSQWSYYFSDIYVISNMPSSGGSNYSVLFFSGIYTLGGISISLVLMLREAIIITLYITLPVLSSLAFTGKGREILIKIWVVFFQSAFLPIPILFLLYIYINLNGNYFQQLGIIILVTIFPALLPYGIYRTAGTKFSSLPFLMEAGAPSIIRNINNSGNLAGLLGSYGKSLSQVYPEGDVSRVLHDLNAGGNNAAK